MIKRILAVLALGTVGLLGLTALPAGAAMGPNVNLKEKAGVLKFKPKTLDLKVGKGKTCKATNYSFSITNKTKSSQEIDYDGNPFTTVPASGESFICIVGVGTSVYSVPNTSAILTVKVSS